MELEEIILKRIKVSGQKWIPKPMLENTHIEVIADNVADRYIVELNTWLATETKEQDFEISVKYPATWWQMLKDQYFPEWFKEKYPVKYTTKKDSIHIDVCKIYPELDHDLSRPLYKMIYRREKDNEAQFSL